MSGAGGRSRRPSPVAPDGPASHAATTPDREWLREVGQRDLNDIHHALRMIVKHPMVGGEEARLFTNLAEACWNEHVRRCAEEREVALTAANRQEYPPPQGRTFDPDWSPALVALFVVWMAVWCVGAYFFWRFA